MKPKTFEVSLPLGLNDLEDEVNEWLRGHPTAQPLYRDFHTESGINLMSEPFSVLTLLVWYREE